MNQTASNNTQASADDALATARLLDGLPVSAVLVETGPFANSTVNPAGTALVLAGNQLALQMLPDLVPGMALVDLFDSASRPALRARLTQAHADTSVRLQTGTGTVNLLPGPVGQGRQICLLEPLPEQPHQGPGALVRSEARYRALVESSREGILVQWNFKPLYANRALLDMIGIASIEEFCALPSLAELVAEEDQQRLLAFTQQRAQGLEAPEQYEFTAIRRDGVRVRMGISVSSVEWDGAPAILNVLTDITSREAHEMALHQAQKMEALGNLTGGIAHDFNNLLAVVRGNLDLLQDRLPGRPGDGSDLHNFVQRSLDAAETAGSLTRRLLGFARREELHPEPVLLTDALTDVLSLLERTLGGDLVLDVQNTATRPALVDQAQLQTSVLNLAINGRDAMPDGGRLEILARDVEADESKRLFGEHRPLVLVRVADTGDGMSDAVRARAFDPFFTTKELGQGTGLGLPMVHGFVTQSGGHINLDSGPGRGTAVELYLPVGDAAALVPRPADDRRRRVLPKVLVVEDEAAVRDVTVAMLEGLGYDVRSAADLHIAEQELAAHAFDLLLSDIMLPAGQRGPMVAAKARELQPDIALLYMSGFADTIDLDQAGPAGVRLLHKPFKLADLRDAVAGAIAIRE